MRAIPNDRSPEIAHHPSRHVTLAGEDGQPRSPRDAGGDWWYNKRSPIVAAQVMVDYKHITHPRLRGVSSGHESVCPKCGDVRFVKDKRSIGRRCFACYAKEKDVKYEHQCPDCGAVSVLHRSRSRTRCRVCALKRRSTTHGLTKHPLYRVIKSAVARCKYPATKDYKWYGGRGISVCDEWVANPAAFIAWALANGWKPGLETDRIDTNGNYNYDNVRFVTHAENCRNRRSSRQNA